VKILFVYPRFRRHADDNPELRTYVPMEEYLGSPSLGIAMTAAVTPPGWEIEYRDDRLAPADGPTDADLVAITFFTAAASRAFELAAAFREQGKTVVAGGIFPTLMPDETAPHFDAVVVGESETVWPRLLDDFESGLLATRYQGQVEPAALPQPRMDLYFGAERDGFRPDDYPVQLSRGCTLICHACALPRSMGKGPRLFPMEHVAGQLETLRAAGKRACLSEDTSWFPGAPRRRLEEVLEHVAAHGGPIISYVGISMPMILLAPAELLRKAKAAGVDMFYLVGGFDPVTMKAFNGDATALARAQAAIARCLEHGIEPYTSFLIGNDGDDEGTVDRMLEFAARAGIRKAEFAVFTPYPGTPSWHRLLDEGRILHHRWSQYNDANVVFRPRRMTPDALHRAYLRLWRDFYVDRTDLLGLSTAARTIQF
jgi:radical SAM superfamily enzyme YgiQ (UPF0313 family)